MTSTLIQTSASGLEVRVALYEFPRWRYTIPFAVLRSVASLAELQNLMGFVAARVGSWDSFLFTDVTDCATTDDGTATGIRSPCPTIPGTGGSGTVFQLARTMGGTLQPVYDIAASPTPKVYLNGTIQVGGYTISATGGLLFGSGPSTGVAVTVDFNYYWRVRLLNDSNDFENFAQGFWEVKKIEMIQVRA